ncbi:MAG: hypothetical protein V4722_12825 [Bacteroidota bacterium]
MKKLEWLQVIAQTFAHDEQPFAQFLVNARIFEFSAMKYASQTFNKAVSGLKIK